MRAILLSAALLASSTFAFATNAWAGKAAAPFTLKDVNGKKFDLKPHLGKDVVVVNFFATWCAPCMAELPALQELHEKYGENGVRFVLVSIDDAKDAAKVKPIVKEQKITFPVLLDTQTKVVSLYNPKKVVPFTVVIGKDGNVVSEHMGFKQGDDARLDEEIARLLAGERGPGRSPVQREAR